MWLVDGLDLHGKSDDGTTSTSPYRVVKDVSVAGGAKRYQWIDTNQAEGSQLLEPPHRENMERKLSLMVFPRFTTSYTNVITNPRPASTTSWAADGTIGSGPTFDSQSDSVYVTTSGNSNTGVKVSFTGTAAKYSAGCWVNAPSGAAMRILFDGESATAFTGTGDWQFVKTENVTLTAATRTLNIEQTSASTQTFYVKWATCVQATAFPTDIQGKYATFHGGCGDAKWTGTADASTSTTMTTAQDAVGHAIGALEAKGELAESKAYTGGIVYTWQPQGSTFEVYCDMLAGEVTDITYDFNHAVNHVAACEFTIALAPYCEAPEALVATGYRRAGQSACSLTTSSLGGDLPARARYEITSTSTSDQRFVAIGSQWHDTDSNSLIIGAASFGVSGYSGALTSATNEVQTLTKSGTISGGTYTLTMDGQTTGTLQYNDNAATIQAALEALTNIGSGNVTVGGGPISSANVTFTYGSELAGANVPQLSITSSLTGGGSASMSTTTPGVIPYVSSSLYSDWTTICDSGAISFVGTYRVFASVYDAAATSQIGSALIKLTYGVGDLASVKTNAITSPPAVGDLSIVDLGDVSIPAIPSGTQQWKALIQAKTTGTVGNALRILKLWFIPTETADAVVKSVNPSISSELAADDFSSISGVMSGDSAQLGGTYAKTGDTDDYSADGTYGGVSRTATSDSSGIGCYELLTISHTAIDASLGLGFDTSAGSFTPNAIQSLVLRYVDANNYLLVYRRVNSVVASATFTQTFYVVKCIAGSRTTIASGAVSTSGGVGPYENPDALRCTVSADGLVVVYSDGVQQVSVTDSALATGGTLATGAKLGLYDEYTSASAATRHYYHLSVSGLVNQNATALNTTRKIEFRDDGSAWRTDTTGTYYGYPQQQTIPVAPVLGPSSHGQPNNRIVALTSRNNPDLASDPAWDPFTLKVYAKRRFSLHRWES